MSTTNPPRVVTGDVCLSYANIFEAKSIRGSNPENSVPLIAPKSDSQTLAKIGRGIDAAIDVGIGKLAGMRPNRVALKLPLGDGEPLSGTRISAEVDFGGFTNASDDFLGQEIGEAS